MRDPTVLRKYEMDFERSRIWELAKIIANAAVGYTVGQTAELAAIGLSAATKSGANASKKTNSATSNARTTKQSNTRVITTVSGRKKVINKVKKPTRRNTKFWRVCMA